MTPQIVDGTPAHARFVAWVALEAARSHLPRGFWDFYLEGGDAVCLRYLEALASSARPHLFHSSAYLIAEVDGRPVGACWFRLMTAERPGYGFIAEDIPDIGLAVSPAFQGRGIGRRLLETAIAQAQGLGFASLGISVAEENRRACRLYESVGFVAIGREGDSLTMRLDLKDVTPKNHPK